MRNNMEKVLERDARLADLEDTSGNNLGGTLVPIFRFYYDQNFFPLLSPSQKPSEMVPVVLRQQLVD